MALITGLVPFGGMIGPLFLTKFCDIIGRRKTLLILSSVMVVFEAVLACSTNIYMFYIARFVIGLCVGVGVAALPVFLSEISENHNRGTIGCFVGLCIPIGNLYVYIIGPLVSVKAFTFICTLPNIINIVCFMLFIPESPYYLAAKGFKKETIHALERMRNKSESGVEKEYEQIIQTLNNTSQKVESSWSSFYTVRSLRKGFIIAMGLNALQQLSGISAILSYAGPLFDATSASLSGDVIAILIGLVKLLGVVLAAAVIERVGRRPLLMFSTLGGSIPLLLLGIFFHLKNSNSVLINNFLWLPVVSALLFIFSYAVGLGVIPNSIMSELFPSNLKSKASSACCCISLIIKCVVTSIFPIINDFIGPTFCLCIFSLFELVGFLFVYFIMPEIKGKSIEEIQELLAK